MPDTSYFTHLIIDNQLFLLNRGRLTQVDPRDEGRYGQSLFKPLPKDRTCERAGKFGKTLMKCMYPPCVTCTSNQ